MPNFDGRGPQGAGPGKGFGPCGLGLGWRRRFGRGRGMGRYFNWSWPESKEDQKTSLTDYRKALEEELEDVKKEMDELK